MSGSEVTGERAVWRSGDGESHLEVRRWGESSGGQVMGRELSGSQVMGRAVWRSGDRESRLEVR